MPGTKRKFNIEDVVRNTRTGEQGVVTAYDLLPEVYAIQKHGAGAALWGELEMEASRR